MAGNKATKQDTKASNRTRLVDAAIRCIEKHDISATFIDDIAREAGLSRPTAYRTFGSRKALLQAVAAHSANGLKAAMTKKLRKYTTFADAMVHGSTESLYLGRKDKIFTAVLAALGDKGLERYLLDPTGPVFAYTREAWSEAFAKARASGELREGVTDEELTMLICSSNCIFLLRDDMRKKEQIDFLRKFLLPAVLAKSRRS